MEHHWYFRFMNKYILLSFFMVLLSSCEDKSGKDYGKRVITVTIEPLRYFAERIAGDKFEVRTMVPGGGNPETYEPSPKQMVGLSNSELYIKVGSIGFERTWMRKLEANAPHAIVVDSSEGIVPAQSSDGVVDPHTWMSATSSVIIARNIYKALVGIDGKDSLYFKRNLEKLIVDIGDVDTKVRAMLTKEKSQAFLIYHPILTYFARDYNLRQIPMEEEGREPSAGQLESVIKRAKAERAKTFFVQKEFANRNADVVIKSVGAHKEEINPLGYDWCKEMISIARKLR